MNKARITKQVIFNFRKDIDASNSLEASHNCAKNHIDFHSTMINSEDAFYVEGKKVPFWYIIELRDFLNDIIENSKKP